MKLSNGTQELFDGTINFLLKCATSKGTLLKQLFFISPKEVSTWRIIMCDAITDPIDLKKSVGREFRLLYSFKILNFSPIFDFIALLIMWSLFSKHCSSF